LQIPRFIEPAFLRLYQLRGKSGVGSARVDRDCARAFRTLNVYRGLKRRHRDAHQPPVVAGDPVPGSRLLQGMAVSRKYGQRVRCNRFPATVAMLRICGDAPFRMACDRTE
jgi:hypothetical protein